MNFRDEADTYVSLGWKVFPLSPGSKHPFKDSKGVVDASDNPDTIDRWHAREPNSNIAIACGASSLMVVDLDPRNGCWETIRLWESQKKVFPLTVHAETRSRGLHLYFALEKPLPEGWRRKLRGGIDVQVGNKYVVAPPSVIDADKVDDKQSGCYRWIRRPIGPRLPSPPRWFLEMLRPPPLPKFQARDVHGEVSRRLEGAAMKVSQAAKGHRNDELNKQAHLVGRLVAEEGLNADAAGARLYEAAMSIGLSHHEAMATIASGLRSGMRHAGASGK